MSAKNKGVVYKDGIEYVSATVASDRIGYSRFTIQKKMKAAGIAPAFMMDLGNRGGKDTHFWKWEDIMDVIPPPDADDLDPPAEKVEVAAPVKTKLAVFTEVTRLADTYGLESVASALSYLKA